jgi:hypothetical protein
MESMLLDAAGYRRAPVTMPGYHRGRPPRSRGAVLVRRGKGGNRRAVGMGRWA